jgi:amino acid permease
MVEEGPIRYFAPESTLAFLGSVPVVIFAYTCHQNVSICALVSKSHKLIKPDVLNLE